MIISWGSRPHACIVLRLHSLQLVRHAIACQDEAFVTNEGHVTASEGRKDLQEAARIGLGIEVT